MSFYDLVNTGGNNTGERIALPAGKYGTSKEAGLKVVKYLSSKPSKNDPELVDHGYLVASDNEDGTAFYHLRVKAWWLHDSVAALAFTSDKQDMVASAIAEGKATQTEVDSAIKILEAIAHGKVIAANTPEDKVDEAVATTYKNLLTQIRIAIGEVFRLQDWKGVPRSLEFDPASFDGVSFSGVVEPGYSAGTSEVRSIYGRSRAATAAKVITAETATVPF